MSYKPRLVTAVAAEARQVIWAGQGPALLVNRSPVTPALLSTDEGFDPGGSVVAPLDPFASLSVDGQRSWWAQTITGTAQISSIPGGIAWSTPPQAQAPLVSKGSFTLAANQAIPFGPFAVAGYASLLVQARDLAAGNGVQVALAFFEDQAMTYQVSAPTWLLNTTLAGSTSLLASVPVLAAWALLTITEKAGVPASLRIKLSGSTTPSTDITYPNQAQSYVSLGPISVPAATTQASQVTTGAIVKGTGYLTIIPGDATSSLDFQTAKMNVNGTVNQLLDDLGTMATRTRFQVNTPDALFGLAVVNNDGANPHSYTFYNSVLPQV